MPSWPGQRRRRRWLHNSDSNPPRATRFPHPRARRWGGGNQVAPEVAWVRSAPAEIRRSERERRRWLEAKRSAGRGRRAAGNALFVWFAPGTGLARGAGARAPCGLRCVASASARGSAARGPREGGGSRAAGGVGRLRGRSRRPRAAIITEPPFSGWLCLEEPRAVGAHPKLSAGRPLCERPRRAGSAGSAPALGRTVFPEVTFRNCSRLDFKLVFPPLLHRQWTKEK